MKKVVLFSCAVFLISGCATSSQDIAPSYVSPLQYQAHDCDQLATEAARVQTRVQQVGGRLDQASSNDKMIVAGSLIFWPALFALGGTKQQEAEFARLKGEYEAIQQSATQKKCSSLIVKQPEQPASAASHVADALPVKQ